MRWIYFTTFYQNISFQQLWSLKVFQICRPALILLCPSFINKVHRRADGCLCLLSSLLL